MELNKLVRFPIHLRCSMKPSLLLVLPLKT